MAITIMGGRGSRFNPYKRGMPKTNNKRKCCDITFLSKKADCKMQNIEGGKKKTKYQNACPPILRP